MQREIISAQQNLVAAQQNIVATLQSLQQQVSDGFAAQAERHNELMVRVERLERGNPPPATES
jgi:phage-related tail protein